MKTLLFNVCRGKDATGVVRKRTALLQYQSQGVVVLGGDQLRKVIRPITRVGRHYIYSQNQLHLNQNMQLPGREGREGSRRAAWASREEAG